MSRPRLLRRGRYHRDGDRTTRIHSRCNVSEILPTRTPHCRLPVAPEWYGNRTNATADGQVLPAERSKGE